MINDKRACEDSLYGSLTRTATWRRGMSAKYPQDSRNQKAAETLDKLADEIQLTDEQWAQLVLHFDWSSATWADAVSLASRHVEFQRSIRTLPAFVNDLIGILSGQNRATA